MDDVDVLCGCLWCLCGCLYVDVYVDVFYVDVYMDAMWMCYMDVYVLASMWM